MILSSSSGKNTTLLGGLPTYETRNDRSEIFQDLVTCISFVRLCQMAYNKITYSMGSMNRTTREQKLHGFEIESPAQEAGKSLVSCPTCKVLQGKEIRLRRGTDQGSEEWGVKLPDGGKNILPDILKFILLDFQEVRIFTPILWAWGLTPFSEPIMCYNWHYYVSTISPNLKTVNSVLNEKISSNNSVQSSLPFLSCPANLLYGNFWFSHSDYDVSTVAEMF